LGSDPGDYIGGGQTMVFVENRPADAATSPSAANDSELA